jgi:predicted NBD/HSP70 family sugar kinase
VGAVRCEVLAVGLDGRIEPHRVRTFSTPADYPDLVKAIVREARKLTSGKAPRLAGLGISMPGLLHRRDKRTLASPNLHQTEGQRLGVDLEKERGLETVILQESHALCLAEQTFGAARDVDDFAMFDVSEGLGVGLVNNGRILSGHSGLAGELGHVTVELNGRPCGCGNRGCLETVATDTALAAAVSDRVQTTLSIDEAIARLQADLPRFEPEVDDFLQYLAAGLAAVINLFNPSKVFLHGRFLDVGPTMFQRLLDLTRKRALPPSLAECEVIRARGNKRLGAVAGIIRHLTTGRDEP